MHRYREFGLLSDHDEQLRRAFRDGFKRAGLSFSQLLDALAWYRDHVRAGASEEHLIEAFSRFAADREWSPIHRDAAFDTYRAIRDNGVAAVIEPAPHRDADRETLAEGERILRADPARYWRDADLQDALFESRERLDTAPAATSETAQRPSTGDRRRIEEIEALLRDPNGNGQRRYWSDDTLRADYAQVLARVHGEAITPEGENVAATAPIASSERGAPERLA
jgi:hypothetical protein